MNISTDMSSVSPVGQARTGQETAALSAQNLVKRFGSLEAVRDLSLTIRQGDIHGFLGPNGAGKTTSIRMMLNLIEPTSGSAKIFGHDVRKDFKRAISQVGAMVEGPAFYPYLSGRRNLRLFGRLSGGVGEDRIKEVLSLVGLGRRGDHKVSGYSQGMRQRLGIALALLHRPKLLVLDEPTNGLDPQGMREVRNLVRRVRDEEGTTVFLSSHLLAEMEMICDRISIIFRGEIIREGRMEELLKEGANMVSLSVDEAEDRRAIEFLKKRFDIEGKLVKRGKIEFRRGNCRISEINKNLVGAGFSVSAISPRGSSLEEYFVELTGESQDVY